MYKVTYNKYGNKSSFYDGYWYQSKLEANYARELDLRVKAKDIKSWDRQVVIEVRFYDQLFTKYKMDFKIIHNDQSIEWIEVKGYEDPAWKYRWKALEIYMNHFYPDDRLSIIKAKDINLFS